MKHDDAGNSARFMAWRISPKISLRFVPLVFLVFSCWPFEGLQLRHNRITVADTALPKSLFLFCLFVCLFGWLFVRLFEHGATRSVKQQFTFFFFFCQ